MKKECNHNAKYITKLIDEENKHIAHLNRIVIESLHEKEALVSKIFHEYKQEKLTFGMRLADLVATFGGSWRFIIIFSIIFVSWMCINKILSSSAFDPYPYILLNLVLSCLASLQAPIILMSQNRHADKERKRSEHEYVINLKAELQIRELNSKVDLLIVEQMKILLEVQNAQLISLNHLEEKLDKLNKVRQRL